jgi:sugar lactone lactonase YvrE
MTKIAEPILEANAVLGEGSLWDHQLNCLYWVDIPEGKVNIYDPATGANSVFTVAQDVGTVVTDTTGNLMLALRDGFGRLDIVSPTRQVAAFDYDIDSGNISNRKAAIKIEEKLGFPDGMAIDEADMVWIAHWGGGKVTRWNPKTGKLLETIKVPHANLVTSCAFGGPNLNELFITTATVDLNEEQKRSQTLAGSLFRVQLDVKGVPAFRFKG